MTARSKGSEASAEAPKRVLVPSALGTLGLSYRDRTIVGLDIVPKGARRRQFEPLKKHGRSEFVDEALGRISEYLAGARRNFGFELSLNDYDFDPLVVRTFVEDMLGIGIVVRLLIVCPKIRFQLPTSTCQ